MANWDNIPPWKRRLFTLWSDAEQRAFIQSNPDDGHQLYRDGLAREFDLRDKYKSSRDPRVFLPPYATPPEGGPDNKTFFDYVQSHAPRNAGVR